MTSLVPLLASSTLLFGALTIAQDAPAAKPLVKVSWKERHEQKTLATGEFVAGQDGQPDVLKLANTEPGPKQFSLIELEPPPIADKTYAVRGKIRYNGVEGTAHLEMWNHFAGGGMYFTKTLAEAGGPLGVIRGSSDWREFALPFNKDTAPSPTKLVINLVLPGRGVVEITDLALTAPADDLFGNVPGNWWPEQVAALIGGIGGSVLGVFLGCIIAPLIATGRARHFVYIALSAIGGCGLSAVVAGVAALSVGQPYHVYYPTLLLGGLSAVFGIGGFVMALARYRQHDLRRMSALDVG